MIEPKPGVGSTSSTTIPPSPLVLRREWMSAPSPATQPSAKWRLAAPRRPLRGHWPRPRDCNVAASAQSSAFLYFILSLFIGPFFLQGVLDRHRETERVSLTVCFFYFFISACLSWLGGVCARQGPGETPLLSPVLIDKTSFCCTH